MTELATYCGAWSADGAIKRYSCRHIDVVELEHLHERARTTGIVSGLKPGSSELDRFIAATLLATLPLIDAQRDEQAKPSLHVVKA